MYVYFRVMIGLTNSTRREHIVRAALEAACHQTREVAEATAADCAPLRRLLADGGMAQNSLFMQMQADILGIPVVSDTGTYHNIPTYFYISQQFCFL